MANIELTDVVDSLSRLQINYTSLAEKFYDIFFNPEPMYVTLVFEDETGEEVEVTIPNRAKDQKYITNGEGSPTGTVSADIGTVYLDTTTGEIYVKYGEEADEWTLIISKNQLDSIIRQVHGSPEGSEVASLGVLCVDLENGYLYMKRTSTGNTGWVRIDSYATSKITEVFTFDKETYSIVISGACENKDVLSIYEDGIKLNPDTYDMPYGDNKTIILRKPIDIPGEGETVEVLVEYFVDIHVAESSAEQRLVDYVKEARFYAEGISPADYSLNYIAEVQEKGDLPDDTSDLSVGDYYYCILEKCFCIWDGSDWEYEYSARYWRDQAESIYESANFDITEAEQAIAEAGQKAQEDFQQLYDDIYNLVVDVREYIDEQYETFSASVNRVDNYAQEVSKDRTAVEIMVDNVKQMEQNVYNYYNYVETQFNELATKTEFQQLRDDLEAELAEYNESLSIDIQYVNNNLGNKIDSIYEELTQALYDESSERTKDATRLQGNIEFIESTFENWIASHADLGDFTNDAGYYNRDNFPIDLNGIYSYSKIMTITEDTTNILMPVTKDCSYYSVDVGEYMETVTGEDTTFGFTIRPDSSTIDFSLPDKLKYDETTKDYDNVVCTARCLIQNTTEYTPTIEWDIAKITWLGSEPELEPKKSYIIEFVSYDMMTSWVAHALGLCQPAIEVDTCTVTFTVKSSTLAATDISQSDTSEIRMVAVIDGSEFTLEDTYEFDNVAQEITVPIEIERRFLGRILEELQIKSEYTPSFERYFQDELEITLEQNKNYTITCDHRKSVDAEFIIFINSETIETYMRGGLTKEEYEAYPAQVEQEETYGVTFVDALPEEGGSGLYVVNSSPERFWTWYASMETWVSSTRIVPTSEFLTQLDVKGKFKFDWGNVSEDTEITRTYYYDDSENTSNGVSFDFHASDGVMVDPLAIRAEDNHVTNIKLRYDAMDEGRCVSSEDALTVKTGTESSPATVYVNAETLADWD